MKKYFFFQPAILLFFILSIILFSCAKEKIVSNPANNEDAVTNSSAERVAKWGSVTGIIMPARTEVKIRVYDRYFSSDTYHYTRDGHFRVDRLPAGIYTLEVLNIATLVVVEIPEVKVQWGNVTDIGRIFFQ
ncbi:MAG TPA: hypothetical protein VIZ28_10105 [Chitinophagaceae bacterium]